MPHLFGVEVKHTVIVELSATEGLDPGRDAATRRFRRSHCVSASKSKTVRFETSQAASASIDVAGHFQPSTRPRFSMPSGNPPLRLFLVGYGNHVTADSYSLGCGYKIQRFRGFSIDVDQFCPVADIDSAAGEISRQNQAGRGRE